MNRESLISKLREVNPNLWVRAKYFGLTVSVDRAESYRGSYDCIALSVDENAMSNYNTVEWLIRELESVNILHGYKGGEYAVNEHAHVYVSPYGHCTGLYVSGISTSVTECVLLTTEEH